VTISQEVLYLSVCENLLIVEDDPEWCRAYARVAASEGLTTIKVAERLDEASLLVDDMRFAVAFIDIGLNVDEDQNVDGLRVMAKIREMGDQTSIVVITGRSGRDVLPITRDSIVKYQAHEIVGKPDIGLQDLRNLLRSGLAAFRERAAADPPAHELLRGDVPSLTWDDRMLRVTAVQDGVRGLYDFLDGLMAGLLPVVRDRSGAAVTADTGTGVMHGSYWSRAIGRAIAVCFGDAELAMQQIHAGLSGERLLGHYHVGALLQESQGHGLAGGVFELRDVSRDSFGAV
jgi:ActR/RegA family two-component response regulator